MKKLALVLAVAFAFGGALYAQGGGGGVGGAGGGGWPGGRGGNQGPKAPDDPNNKNKNGGQGQGGGQDWKKQWDDAVNALGWGEDGTEERVEPGQTVPDKDKEVWLETEATKLGLEEKKIRSDFKKVGLKAWKDSENEDQKFAQVYKIYKDLKDADKKLEEPRKKHLEALKKIWDKCDEDMTKKKALNEDQLKTWQEDTKKMRSETATDKSAAQDKIRARKIDEMRKQYLGGGDEEKKEPEKKAKKKDEGEEDKKPAEGEKKPAEGETEKK
jgi:hypothetical protein